MSSAAAGRHFSNAMKKRAQPSLFICHANADRTLALLLKDSLKNRIRHQGRTVRIFCSSDIDSIRGGQSWFNQIIAALRNSRVCISILTPNSIHLPWVLFETGGAFVRIGPNSDFRMFPVIAGGARSGDLPGPLAHIQARSLGNRSELRQLIREIAYLYGQHSLALPAHESARICKLARRGASNWNRTKRAFIGERLGSSPFDANEMLSKAKRHFFVAGQNLHHIATSKKFRERLFAWLRKSKSHKAQMLLCDPNDTASISAWSKAVGANYQRDIKKSISNFQRWLQLAKAAGFRGRLDIRVTSLVTASIICADPDRTDGSLTTIPVVVGRPISEERPHLFLTKSEHQIVFDHYWDAYKDTFTRAKRLRE
jgi:TIR domain